MADYSWVCFEKEFIESVVRVENFTVAADIEVLSPNDYFKVWAVVELGSSNSKDLNYSLLIRLESVSRQAL